MYLHGPAVCSPRRVCPRVLNREAHHIPIRDQDVVRDAVSVLGSGGSVVSVSGRYKDILFSCQCYQILLSH